MLATACHVSVSLDLAFVIGITQGLSYAVLGAEIEGWSRIVDRG